MNKEEVLDDMSMPTSKNNNLSKRFHRLERIFTAVFILGYLSKWFHLKGADVMIILSLTALAVLYTSLLFLVNKQQYTEQFKPTLRFVAGLVLSVSIFGLLFRIMFWAGAFKLVLAGPFTLLFGIVLLIIPELFYTGSNTRSGGLRFLFWGALATFYMLLPAKTQIMWRYLNTDHYLRDAYMDYYENQEDTSKLRKYIELEKMYRDSVAEERKKRR